MTTIDSPVAGGFQGGEYDFRLENSAKSWATGYDSRIDKGPDHQGDDSARDPNGHAGFCYNTRRPFFQDPRARKRFAYVFDFEWLNKNLLYGAYT
jgi:microcin C transport system substrate-binding protein